MLQNNRLKNILVNKKADLHWDYIIGFIIVAFLIIFGIWFAYKSGKFTQEIWPQF
ncbi:MAG: hypothetical protein AABX39_02750 [Nanoarchaeota archaeon]